MCERNTAQVVIGAQFGDEGKGRMIDSYAARAGHESIVIRFNGGAQAGHTVMTPEGLRHVFSHVGSGAFVGAATFLSRFFVSHPMLFLKEIESLATKGVHPMVYVDPQSPVTTPYDIMINQLIERERGADRHGSCGIGFGETIERNLTPAYALTVSDLADGSALAAKLDAIRREYTPARLTRLGFADAFEWNTDLLLSDAILKHFIDDAGRFLQLTTVADVQTATRGRHLLFEGAQGLLLDQDCGFFPHVTRSNTGLRNVLALAAELDLTQLQVTYVTRPYTTRHGAGPLSHALARKPYSGIVDTTNIPNDWQGTLRFGWLDLDVLGEAIAGDLAAAEKIPVSIEARLAVTCVDQVNGDRMTYYSRGKRHQASITEFIAVLAGILNRKDILLGYGPDRASGLISPSELTLR
ncbi:MAG: adenylosuccinate synthetase [Candidatus Competibacteraceae bacterium]|nr:adenylosuccinate synthetase [Candidatus Competibacteraceae bacterium]